MKKEYNFKNSKSNPYAAKLRKPISIRLRVDTLAYFKNEALKIGIPYQKLINMYLSDCVTQRLKPTIRWK